MDNFPTIQIHVTGPVDIHLAPENLMSSVAEILAAQQQSLDHLQTMSTKLDSIIAVITSLRNQGGASAAELDQILTAAQSIQSAEGDVEAKEDVALQPPAPPVGG